MRKILFAISMLLVMVACTNNSTETVMQQAETDEVAFEVAKNYFFKNLFL